MPDNQNPERQNFVKECIEKYRSKLLDTSKRNSLISFNHSERSRQHIRIIDELPDFLYGQFLDGKTLTFLSLPEEDQLPPDELKQDFRSRLEQAKLTDEEYMEAIDSVNEDEEGALDKIKQIERDLRNKIREELGLPVWKDQKNLTNAEVAKKHDLNPSYEMPEPTAENQEDAVRHIDKYIQTLLKPEEMSRKLSGLASYVRSDIEESGVNTLYAAFGFLQWYESENTDKPCTSPLLLLQLEIEKKQSREGYVYRVQATGEEPEINLSISERLRVDFGIDLPDFTGEDGPETYMQKVADLIKDANVPKKEKWRVRRFLTIGRFRFARLVMFHDLSEKKWPGSSSVATNEIVQNLFSGADNDNVNDHAEDYDIDTPEVEEAVPLLITSADASQHSALVDVMKGENLAIKGPPGTGKSQTITNIIANALAKGKSVLFLAEKMAALNVVHERLSNADLGPYCLELHSTKAKKTEVLKSIENRLKLKSSSGSNSHLASKIEDFKRHRDHITKYIDVLNSEFGRQRKTIHDNLWAAQRRKDQLGDLLTIVGQAKIPFEQADLSASELKKHTDELKTIVSFKKEVLKESKKGQHPWEFITQYNLNPFQQDELKQLLSEWTEQLLLLHKVFNSFLKDFDLDIPSNAQYLKAFIEQTEELVSWNIKDLDQALLAKLGDATKTEEFTSFIKAIRTYRSSLKKIRSLNEQAFTAVISKNLQERIAEAEKFDIQHLTASEIRTLIKTLEDERKLWEKNLKKLLKVGERFYISENEELERIYALAELPDYVASVPREYLLYRSPNIIDEVNSERLKKATEVQTSVLSTVAKLEKNYDLSMMGQPHEIRIYAATLSNAGLLSIFDSSYRQAKKLYKLSRKNKQKFDASSASAVLRDIADVKQLSHEIEQDAQLKDICGSSFDGMNTDFSKLKTVNEWANSVRNRYTAGDDFNLNVRKWLLSANMEDLDTVRELAKDDSFIALKEKISVIKTQESPELPIDRYLESISDKIQKLTQLRADLKNMSRDDKVTFLDISKDISLIETAERSKNTLEDNKVIKKILGVKYQGAETDIEDLEKNADFVTEFCDIPELKENIGKFFNKDFAKRWKTFIEHRKAIEKQLESTTGYAELVGEIVETQFNGDLWESVPYKELTKTLQNALQEPNSLSRWIEFNSHIEQASIDIKGDLLKVFEQEDISFETLPLAFEYMVYSAVAREIYSENPEITSTNGLKLEQARTRIKELDQEIFELQQSELCNNLKKARPLPGNGRGRKSTWTEGSLLTNEINKKRCHVPIRDLMRRAGQSIKKIKPCFLMSPLTVAQYLEPGKFEFDLVVIDEASQMRPEDSLGGIARAKQIVVVGDPQQLPPTSFFQSAGANDEDEEDDFNSEAIMDMALTSFRPSRILSRHYRSQHESLIAFSNYHFYDQSLVLFPSPIKNPDELGVRLEFVGGTYASNSNMDEVQAVVKAALDFMRKHPDRSLGIATMNQVQKDLIEIEMDRAFIDHPHAAQYKAQWESSLESFFVKNLESVQGDERDAIFISTVYGPDKNGTVMQRFGPINRAGGYRRLNVLFSRAKKNMVVFTSLKPEDIKVSDSSSQGVRALKGFLSYAAKGIIDEGETTGLDPDSDFEIWVKEKLESIGCEVHPQVGVAGYRIDLGIKHPKYPYGYLMGVECDGATYHSSKSARERDVIRQQVLEGLGWRIYRIWSTDWFSNPAEELEKLKSYIQNLLKNEGTSNNIKKDPPVIPEKLPEIVEKEGNLFAVAEKQHIENAETVVQLYDNVTYLMIKSCGKEEKRSVQIVPTQGDPNGGSIGQHSAIGRALLGALKGDEIEAVLPIGEVSLIVQEISKAS